MKIPFLFDDLPPVSFGGARIVAYTIAHTFIKLGHDISVITTTQDKNSEGDYLQYNFIF